MTNRKQPTPDNGPNEPNIRTGGQDVCHWSAQGSFTGPLRALLHPPARLLGSWVRPGMTALDLGCGLGHFSLGMARLVGARGRVAAVDLQQGALDVVTRRAERAGLAGVLSTHRCEAGTLGELPRADFVLAFWMVHETPDVGAFFRQVAALLHPGGRLLFAEPPLHVSRGAFEEEVRLAQGAGLTLEARPRMALCRAALLRLDGRGNEGMDEGMDVRSNEAERVARDPG